MFPSPGCRRSKQPDGYYDWVYQHHIRHQGELARKRGHRDRRARGRDPARIICVSPGGDVNALPPYLLELQRPQCAEANLWYDMHLHIRWSKQADGFCNWRIDNALVYQSGDLPTLGYNGTATDDPNYQLSRSYHYRGRCRQHGLPLPLKIGTTREIVAF